MTLLKELLHQYTRVLDKHGESRNQKIYLSEEGIKEFKSVFMRQILNKEKAGLIINHDKQTVSLKFDGYEFEIINIRKNER